MAPSVHGAVFFFLNNYWTIDLETPIIINLILHLIGLLRFALICVPVLCFF